MTESSGGRKLHKARKTPTTVYSSSPPTLPSAIEASYHAIDRSLVSPFEESSKETIVTSQILYKPGLVASARIGLHGTRWSLHYEREITKVILFPSKHQLCEWDKNLNPNWEFHDSRSDPEPQSLFYIDANYDFSAENFESLQEDFIQYLTSNETLKIEYNPFFKLDRKMDETEENFSTRCMEKAHENFNQEMHQLEETLQRLQDRSKQKLEREVREIGTESNRRSGEIDVQEEIDAHDSKKTIEDIKREMSGTQQLRETKMKEFEENIATFARERESEIFRINSSQIHVLRFGLIWLPYIEFVIQEKDSRRLELIQSF